MPLYVALMIPNCNESPVSISVHGLGLRGREINLASQDSRGTPGPVGVGYYHTYNVLYDSPTLVKIGNLNPPFTNQSYAIGFESRSGSYAATLECPTPDLSGIYFINPDKTAKRDSYYSGIDKKIPNPTVRTASFGE